MSDLINKKYCLELEVLSPLHIGSGFEWARGSDFVQDKGKVFLLNHKLVQQKLDIDKFCSFLIDKDEKGLKNNLPGKLEDYSHKIYHYPPVINGDIRRFISGAFDNAPYIPGSSIKGAIRSILFKKWRNYETREDDVLGELKKGEDFLRFVKISDSVAKGTKLVNTKIFNLYKDGSSHNWKGGWKHSGKETNDVFKPSGFNTVYEVLAAGEKSFLTLAIADKVFTWLPQQPYYEQKSTLIDGGIEELFKIINAHTSSHLQKEIAFFEAHYSDKTDIILSSYRELLDLIPLNNRTCILKMAAGSGFHSITGDWKYQDYNATGIHETGKNAGKKKYKSRKIAIDNNRFMPMGFVCLRVLGADETTQYEKARVLKIKQQSSKIEETRNRMMAQRKKEEQERQAKLDEQIRVEEEERANEKERQANIIKFEQQKKAQLLEQKEREEIRKKGKEVKRKQYMQEGLKNKLNQADTFDKGAVIINDFVKTVGEIPESEHDTMFDWLKRVYAHHNLGKKQFKRDWGRNGKGNWGRVRSWVGSAIEREWFNEIVG